MEKSLRRTLPSIRPYHQPVVPDWLQNYADEWDQAEALAVVLFGSRASGYWLPDSDWDIAVVLAKTSQTHESPDIGAKIRETCEIDTAIGTVERFSPSFAYAIRDGLSLVGDIKTVFGKPSNEVHAEMKRRDMLTHLHWTFNNAIHSLHAISAVVAGNNPKTTLETLFNVRSTKESANSAKRCAKALCCLLEVGYDTTHNDPILAQRVPSDWRDLVLKMNGLTHTGHTLGCGQEQTNIQESCQVALTRIGYTLDLLELIKTHDDFPLEDSDWINLKEELMLPGPERVLLEALAIPRSHTQCSKMAERLVELLDPSGELALELGFEKPEEGT